MLILRIDNYFRFVYIYGMNTIMVKVNLSELLEARGVSMYRLAKDSSVAYVTLWKLQTGRAQRIGFDVLEKICTRLDCTPGELLTVIPGKVAKRPAKKGGAK